MLGSMRRVRLTLAGGAATLAGLAFCMDAPTYRAPTGLIWFMAAWAAVFALAAASPTAVVTRLTSWQPSPAERGMLALAVGSAMLMFIAVGEPPPRPWFVFWCALPSLVGSVGLLAIAAVVRRRIRRRRPARVQAWPPPQRWRP
jgi:hypothetical protein